MAVLAVCAIVPALARAESETEKKQQAKEHYEKATRLYDVGKYSEAIAEYEQAYLLMGDPALLFNIGQAYRLWDHTEDAIRAYKNYLRQRPDAVNRADVERKIVELEKVVEERKRGAVQPLPESGPPPAGYPPPSAPPMGLPPPSGATIPPAGPPPAAGPEQPAGVVVAEPGAPAPARPARYWIAYSLFAVSAACLVTAGIAGAVGASKARQLKEASEDHQVFDPSVEASGKTANIWAVTTGVLGLASGGLGAYLFWRERKLARASVAVSPVLLPSFAGGSAALTF
jgi:tetratricopeptide (TPR) repeat protein